jgi:hypothetical protein
MHRVVMGNCDEISRDSGYLPEALGSTSANRNPAMPPASQGRTNSKKDIENSAHHEAAQVKVQTQEMGS